MKVMTIGKSPYLLTSHSQINGAVLKHLYQSGHSTASIVSHHDATYFVPEEDKNGRQHYYYHFDNHKIPLIPFNINKEPSIAVYEILNLFKPDVLISVGDLTDCTFMKAVKMFCEHPFKWIALLTNHSLPINENNMELFEDMDGILCTNSATADKVQKFFIKELNNSYVGTTKEPEIQEIQNRTILRKDKEVDDQFRIMTCGKNAQIDNIPMLMEVAKEARKEIPNLHLYVHANIYDSGDYDLNLIKERIDPEGKLIHFPTKYVSLVDGYSYEEYQAELLASDLFISLSMTASTGLSIFDAISCGCLPLMSNVGCHREIADMIAVFCPEIERNEVLVPCIDLMTVGETYLGICRPDELKKRICRLYNKKSRYEGLIKLTKVHNRKEFFTVLDKIIVDVEKARSSICVETIRR